MVSGSPFRPKGLPSSPSVVPGSRRPPVDPAEEFEEDEDWTRLEAAAAGAGAAAAGPGAAAAGPGAGAGTPATLRAVPTGSAMTNILSSSYFLCTRWISTGA